MKWIDVKDRVPEVGTEVLICLKRGNEELDKLHEQTMENLYEIFEEEFDRYFKYYDAALEVMELGMGTFPFCGRMDDAINPIEKSLQAIEANILDHLKFQLKSIYEERTKGKARDNRHSAQLKKRLSAGIKTSIKEIYGEKMTTTVPT